MSAAKEKSQAPKETPKDPSPLWESAAAPKVVDMSTLMVEVSHLYRKLLHTTPHFVFHENYKGTPETPATLRGRHEYKVEVGLMGTTEKGEPKFTSFKSATGDGFDTALVALMKEIRIDW